MSKYMEDDQLACYRNDTLIKGSDVVVHVHKLGDYSGGGHLKLLVVNAGRIGARWPSLCYYRGQYYKWDTNEPMPPDLSRSHYFGYGVYQQLDPLTFIDADMRVVLQPHDSDSEYI